MLGHSWDIDQIALSGAQEGQKLRLRQSEVRQGLEEIKSWRKISPGHQKERNQTVGMRNWALGLKALRGRGADLIKILGRVRGRVQVPSNGVYELRAGMEMRWEGRKRDKRNWATV